MKNVKRIEIDGKIVQLKKSGDRYRVIYPLKNEDGSINWFNVLTGGSWWNLIWVGAFVLIFVGILYEYSKNLNALLDCFRVPGMLEQCKEAFTPEHLKINIEDILG